MLVIDHQQHGMADPVGKTARATNGACRLCDNGKSAWTAAARICRLSLCGMTQAVVIPPARRG
jgi:hypothetical protein